ncbi:MAG: aldo/keto reductase [Candidatus Aminicenantes bacterium]|nr:aldo/keto reductase [Candidatus Aminicenantes bacterium]
MKNTHLGRRGFLKRTAAGFVGAGLAAGTTWAKGNKPQEANPVRIREYRRLGRTGFQVSDIGAGSITDEGVMAFALDAGVNYIDTAEQYPGHHKLLASVLKGRDRKKLFISTKLKINPEEENTKAFFLKRARKALEELKQEYVDCLMIHMAETVDMLKTEGFHAAIQELKAEGRVKYTGVSNHGSFWYRDPAETMENVLLAAAEDGRFDVFLLAYNFLKMDQGERVLQACREKKIGTVLMKSTPIAIYYSLKTRIEEMEKEGRDIHPLYADGLKRYQEKLARADAFVKQHNLQNPEEIKDAAIQFVLSNPDVNTVACLAKTYDEMERFVVLSGTRLTSVSLARLDAYRKGCGDLYCRHACGVCEPSCPKGVPVNTILRYNHYAALGRERDAMVKYASLKTLRGDSCRDCPGLCESACPFGVPAQGMLLAAHKFLTLSIQSDV